MGAYPACNISASCATKRSLSNIALVQLKELLLLTCTNNLYFWPSRNALTFYYLEGPLLFDRLEVLLLLTISRYFTFDQIGGLLLWTISTYFYFWPTRGMQSTITFDQIEGILFMTNSRDLSLLANSRDLLLFTNSIVGTLYFWPNRGTSLLFTSSTDFYFWPNRRTTLLLTNSRNFYFWPTRSEFIFYHRRLNATGDRIHLHTCYCAVTAATLL